MSHEGSRVSKYSKPEEIRSKGTKKNQRGQMSRRDIAWGGPRSNMVVIQVGGSSGQEVDCYLSRHTRRNLPTACMHQERR